MADDLGFSDLGCYDPTEQKEVTKEFPDRFNTLKALWQDWAAEYDVIPLPGRSGKK